MKNELVIGFNVTGCLNVPRKMPSTVLRLKLHVADTITLMSCKSAAHQQVQSTFNPNTLKHNPILQDNLNTMYTTVFLIGALSFQSYNYQYY